MLCPLKVLNISPTARSWEYLSWGARSRPRVSQGSFSLFGLTQLNGVDRHMRCLKQKALPLLPFHPQVSYLWKLPDLEGGGGGASRTSSHSFRKRPFQEANPQACSGRLFLLWEQAGSMESALLKSSRNQPRAELPLACSWDRRWQHSIRLQGLRSRSSWGPS